MSVKTRFPVAFFKNIKIKYDVYNVSATQAIFCSRANVC